MCATWGVWVEAPYGFALKVTQPGQPVKLFTTDDTDPGKSYLCTRHRATAHRARGTEQAGQGDLGASRCRSSCPQRQRGLRAWGVPPGPLVAVCPGSGSRPLLPETAPARPCPTCSPSSCSRVDLGWEGQRRADHLSCGGKGFGVGVGLPPLAPWRPHHSDSGMGLSYWDSSPSSPTPQSLCPGPPASRLT